MFKAAVVTCSDKGFKHLRKDTSGPYIVSVLEERGFDTLYQLISDEKESIKQALIQFADQEKVDLIITTGGTGFSPRDNTPEATGEVIKRLVPGISEMLRFESYKITKKAYLSRGVSGIRNRTLIINLPGSLSAVKECMSFLDNVLDHGLKILKNVDSECSNENTLL